MTAFALAFLLSWTPCGHAHEGVTDGFGCHVHKAKSTYHCHTGPLSGRTFVSRAAAVQAMLALEKVGESELRTPALAEPVVLPVAKPPPVSELKLSEHEPIKVISWNASQLDKEDMDARQVGQLIALGDIVVFLDLNSGFYGRDGLSRIATSMSSALGEKICKAVSVAPAGAKSRFGFIWKDRKVALLKDNGIVKENCDVSSEIQIALTGSRTVASFFVRHAKQFVNVAPVSNPNEKEIPLLFSHLSLNHWPTIAVGDFKLESSHAAFAGARQAKFAPAFSEFKTGLKSSERGFVRTYENFWARGLGVSESRIVDLAAEYPDVDLESVRTTFSDRCPIYSEFLFVIDEDRPTISPRQPTGEDET